MVARNPDIAQMTEDYLFLKISNKKQALLEKTPHARVISLGIGDTTEPIPEAAIEGFRRKISALATPEGYTGYGDPFGSPELRAQIAKEVYNGRFDADEVFVSDGSKCDLARLQTLFSQKVTSAIQDPAYPVYVGATRMSGKGAITPLRCTPDNGFSPALEQEERTDLIYLCSPNNPTGAVLTHPQLQGAVDLARERRSIIIYDSAYAAFIRDPSLPKSIFDIEGAEEVAIESGSFSKVAGFTGVRIGWTVVPKALTFDDGTRVHDDWKRVSSTFFNGPSNIAEAGALASLTPEGQSATKELCDFYMENAKLLKAAVTAQGFQCYGGENAPYIWVDLNGASSWEMFDTLLEECHLVTTPGVGFGPAGEGFIRLSAFGQRADIIEAADRLTQQMHRLCRRPLSLQEA